MHCVLEFVGNIHKNIDREKERNRNWDKTKKLEIYRAAKGNPREILRDEDN